MSVGHCFTDYWLLRLSLTFSRVFCRDLGYNSLTGKIPSQISTLTKLHAKLYASKSVAIYWALVTYFIECWLCAASLSFSIEFVVTLRFFFAPHMFVHVV